jgi:hypothetical protein
MLLRSNHGRTYSVFESFGISGSEAMGFARNAYRDSTFPDAL